MIVLGLVGGLCWWINLLIVPVLVACVLTLALCRPRVGRAAILAPLAFLVGSLPVWLFATVYQRLPILSVALAAPRQVREHGRHLLANALPRLAGVPDAFMGAGPVLGWGRIYGGQVVAQALRAAAMTVEAEHRPHSLHAYFVRAGNEHQPVLYEVERVREYRAMLAQGGDVQ